MGQIKKLDVVGFESRVDANNLGMDKFAALLEADKALVEAEAILSECGIEGITPTGYVSKAEKIERLCDDASLLLDYPYELTEELLSVDSDFAKRVQEVTNALSTIKIDDIRIKNNFDINTILPYEENASVETDLKEYLTLEDFVGSFEELSPQETTFVKGFTDLLYSPLITDDKDLQAILTDKDGEIQEILYGAEINDTKNKPGRDFLAEVMNILTFGTYSNAIAILGYDPITKELLSEEQRKDLTLSDFKKAFSLGNTSNLGEEVAAYLSTIGDRKGSIFDDHTCQAMAALDLKTYLLASGTGVMAG